MNTSSSVARLLRSAATASLLALGCSLAAAQAVNLGATATTTTLPDGQSVPMWSYLCGTAVPGSSATCAPLNAAAAAAGQWSPVLITLPLTSPTATGSLSIALTNNLPAPVPTSLVIVGQLGGGLGNLTQRTTTVSPDHPAQGATWPIAGDSSGPAFQPPAQPPRVQSFATEVANAGTATLTWANLRPGTYLIESGTHPSIQGPMGLYGVLVVTAPASGNTPAQAYPGVGYDADLPLLLSEIDAQQNQAIATAVATAGFSESATYSIKNADTINSIAVSSGGSGYTSVPSVTVAAPGGSGTTATAVAVIDTDPSSPTYRQVIEIDIVNPGSGYSTDPVVTIAGGGGSGASAAAGRLLAGAAGCSGGAAACYPPVVNYDPRYYLINGRSFDRTQAALSLLPVTATPVTGQVLLRFVNAGLRMHIPSVVGLKLALLAEDGHPLPGVPKVQNEVFLAAGKTYDASVTPPQSGGTFSAAAYPLFDRQLSLSTNNERDGGMQAYVQINGGAAPALPSASATATAVADSYFLVPGTALVVSDPALGVMKNDIGIYGVAVHTPPTGGVLSLSANGSFSYTPNAGTVADSFSYCGNGASSGSACTTVTLAACTGACLGAPPSATAASFSSNIASALHAGAPGLLAFASDPSGLPLTAALGALPANLAVTLNADGSFDARASGAGNTGCAAGLPAGSRCFSFAYSVRNSHGASSGSANVTLAFLPASGLTVSVYDAPAFNVNPATAWAITDYRWIIEEDRSILINPAGQTNTGTSVRNVGTNFHTSYMPVVASGCVGKFACEYGQTLLKQAAVCDQGNGVCRLDPSGQKTPLDPSQVYLDPNKRYYISILPGDGGNPFAAGSGAPVPINPADPNSATRPFSIGTDCPSPADFAPGSGKCGHGMGGAPIKPGATAVNVVLQETPYATAKIAVFVFEDDMPLNGEHDAGGGVDVLAPNEPGLGGFEINLFDDAGGPGDATGQITYDMFNMPISNSLAGTIDPVSGLDACPISATSSDGIVGRIVTCPKYEADGKTLSPLAGQAIIANLYPGRYGVVANPGADRIGRGEEWLQTNTLDGQKAHDSFIKVGGPGYFQEYGPAGFHVAIGFANPAIINGRLGHTGDGLALECSNQPCLNTIKGKITGLRISRTPDQRLYSSGSRDALGFTQCYVSLGDPDGADIAFTKCDSDGNFVLANIPDGSWRLTILDQWNDQIVDGLSTPAAVKASGGVGQVLDMKDIPVTQWHTNVYTRSFIDSNGDGVSQPGEPGLPLVPTNIRFRDGSYSNFNNTDLNGYAGFNEIFPLFNWYVIETDSTRYKQTGVHVVYDVGGPADGTPGGGGSSIAANLANTLETVPLPADLRFPGSVYCANADCNGFSIKSGPTSSQTGSSGRIDPPWVTTEAWQGFIGQAEFVEFGKTPFAANENGGIRGEVVYASTRPFDDPSLLLHLSWTPNVPNVTVNLYRKGTAPDGTASLTLVDSTRTSSWDDWAQGFRSDGKPNMNCPGQMADSPFFFTLQNNTQWLDPNNTALPYASQYKCYDGLSMYNQVQPAPYDGMYQFPSVTARHPVTGLPTGTNCKICVPNPTGDGTQMLPSGTYVVEVIVPPGYELVKEEDKNILIGDNYIAPVTQQFAGLGNVFILPDQAAVNSAQNPNNPQNPTNNLGSVTFPRGEGDTGNIEQFWPCVGATRVVPDFISLFPGSQEVAPFAGATRNLCDRKEVTLHDESAALAKFYLFSSTHVAAHFTGIILDDLSSEFDPFSPQFGEKFAVPSLPVSFKDYAGNEITRVYADQWGQFNGITYSSWEVNPPNPTGYAPQMMVTCMNDPGTGPTPDTGYNPGYSTFCYEIPFMPGQTQYMDTPVVPTMAFAQGYNPPDCAYPDTTPAIRRVDSSDGIGPWVAGANGTRAVTTLALTSGGSGYSTVPIVGFSGGGSGSSSASATATTTISSVTVDNRGSGYSAAPVVAFSGTSASGAAATATMRVNAFTVTHGGSGYTATPHVCLSGGGGSGASASAHLSGGAVTSITINNSGSGYTSAPTVSIGSGSGCSGNTSAQASATLSINAIALTSGGAGYSTTPFVGFSGGGGSGATAHVAMSVDSLTLTGGGGYTSTTAPSVNFSAASGSGAHATATLAAATTAHSLTITALGDQSVPNNAYNGPQATAAPFNQKFITRHYGFGATQGTGSVSIGGVNAPVTAWSDTSITVNVPSLPACSVQSFGAPGTLCGELVITAGNGRKSIDAVTVTVGGKAPTYLTAENPASNALQTAIDNAQPGDLIIAGPPAGVTTPLTFTEMLLMWKPVRLQGVGASAVTINANTHPSGKLDAWRQRINCLFGLTLQGRPTSAAYNGCAASQLATVDRIPLEGILGWDTTVNGNLAGALQEPTLLGAYEGAGVTVLAKGVRTPAGATLDDIYGVGAEGAFPAGTVYLGANAADCAQFPANFLCNPSRIDGLTITNSSQGGGGVFVHGWNHFLEIANNRIYSNAGTLSGGISIGQGEFGDANLVGGDPVVPPLPSNAPGQNGPTNTQLPYWLQHDVNVHHNAVTQNAAYGDELYSATPAGAGGVTFCTGADNYKFQFNWVCGNLSSGDGGGVAHLGFSYNGNVSNNQILFNQSTNPTIPTNGGGLLIAGAGPDGFVNGVECGTTTDVDCAPGLSEGVGPNLLVDANLVLGNSAESGSGGGIRLQLVNGTEVTEFPTDPTQWYQVTLSNNIVSNNVAGFDGGGVSMQDALRLKIVNNTVAANDSTASAGVLFNTLGAPLSSTPPPGCDPNTGTGCGTSIAPSAQQPAGVVTMLHTPNLNAAMVTGITCPAGYANDCQKVSKPVLENNLFWQNRAFHIQVGGLGTGMLSQQNLVTLLPGLTQTASGACPAGASYWDIGVRFDNSATDHSATGTGTGYVLNPQYSILSAADPAYAGTNLAPASPGVVAESCNGSRVPPETCAGAANAAQCYLSMGYGVPPGVSDATLPNPLFSLTPAATVDEGNNWINMSYGPLSLVNPVTNATLSNYALVAGSAAIDKVPSTATTYADAPNHDFLGHARKQGNSAVDIGAVEFVAPAATPALSVAPTSLAFGNVTVGTTSTARTLTVTNTGSAAFNGPGGITTTFTGPYARSGGSCSATTTLAVNASCTVSVVFAPTAAGSAPGVATLTAAVPVSGSPVSLGGTGISVPPRPVLTTLDNFNRGNATTLGASWQELNLLGLGGPIGIASNTASGQALGFAYWNGAGAGGPVFGNRQAAAVTIANTTPNLASLLLKVSGTYNTSTGLYPNGIEVQYNAGTVSVITYNNYTATTQGSFAATFGNGNTLEAFVDETGTVYVWNGTTFVGSVVLAPDPGNLWTTGGGRLGMGEVLGNRLDNFSGATVP